MATYGHTRSKISPSRMVMGQRLSGFIVRSGMERGMQK